MKKNITYIHMTQETTTSSGLLLPLKLISRSLDIDSPINRTIRSGIVQRLEEKLGEVELIPEEELPMLTMLLNKIAPVEPKVVAEVKQIIEKFHPAQ